MIVRRLGVWSLCLIVMSLSACEEKKSKFDKYKFAAAPCESDKDCAKDFICTEKKCVKGQRTKQQLAAKKQAARAAKLQALAAKHKVKAGEGRLKVRLCPGFKNTPEAIGTIIATHQVSKKRHLLHLARETRELAWETEFTFRSLPLGKYDVIAEYGIQKGGRPDTVRLKCDPKAKQACRGEMIREMEVVLPKDEPPVERDDKGKQKHKACDWIAE